MSYHVGYYDAEQEMYRKIKIPGVGTSIRDVDLFTMNFSNEGELRAYLTAKSYLYHTKRDAYLCPVLFYNHSDGKPVESGFLYKKDLVLTNNPLYVYNTVIDKMNIEKDYQFVYELAEHFQNNYLCAKEARHVMNEVSDVIDKESFHGNRKYIYFEFKDNNGDNFYERMVKSIIFEHSVCGNRIFYKDTTNYRFFREIITFLKEYNKKKEMEEKKIKKIATR